MDSINEKIAEVGARFGVGGGLTAVTLIETGNINRTYRAVFESGTYIAQKINTYVFKNPEAVMRNIGLVTAHLRRKISAEGRDPSRETLTFLYTTEEAPAAKNFTVHNGEYWRMYKYIDKAYSCDRAPDAQIMYNAGAAFGQFQRRLSDFPMEQLAETIPDFHNTPKRFDALFDSAKTDKCGRAASVAAELEYLASRRGRASELCEMLAAGILPLRVTHNDTKYNNILIDEATGEGLCVIDLDTVMPGLAAYDFGDAIRFAANTAAEDDPDLEAVTLNLEYYEAFARGFIGASQGFFTQAEIKSMPLGAFTMTVELAARFLCDYIDGDKYFKVTRDGHNLDRARNQIKLAREIERLYGNLSEITG